ncbi:type VI secretion protein [Candidatus Magnetomorum sp. HK-1]|nr:type VI secretion protein [Candidatus Magnetomorum sp. HK-1]
MSKPAARLTDFHTCPMVTPGVPPVPHVGGPITGSGCPTVLIGGMPAATIGDMCVCVGPPDIIAMGSTGVLIGGKPAARMGDNTAHGGIISIGCPTVLIGETSGGGGAGSAGSTSGGSADGDKHSGNTLEISSADPFENNPKYSNGTLGEMNPIQVATMSSALRQAANSGKPFCEACEKAESEMQAEKNVAKDPNNNIYNRDLDKERNMRKQAAIAGKMLMECKCLKN